MGEAGVRKRLGRPGKGGKSPAPLPVKASVSPPPHLPSGRCGRARRGLPGSASPCARSPKPCHLLSPQPKPGGALYAVPLPPPHAAQPARGRPSPGVCGRQVLRRGHHRALDLVPPAARAARPRAGRRCQCRAPHAGKPAQVQRGRERHGAVVCTAAISPQRPRAECSPSSAVLGSLRASRPRRLAWPPLVTRSKPDPPLAGPTAYPAHYTSHYPPHY